VSKTPSPEGLKRLIKVSNRQHGTQFVRKTLNSQLYPLRDLIYGLLKNQAMTTRELIGCLLSDPYNISPRELESMALVLENLAEHNILEVSFRIHNDNFEIEPLFETS